MSDSRDVARATGNPRPLLQLVGGIGVAGVYAIVDQAHLRHGGSLFGTVPDGARSNFYISIAASSAGLLGFAITAASILLALGGGRRLAWLRKQPAFQQTRVVMMAAIRALAASTIVYSVMIIVDTGLPGSWLLEAIAAGVLAVVLVRLGWVLWLINELLQLALRDQSEAAAGKTGPEPFTEPEDPPLLT